MINGNLSPSAVWVVSVRGGAPVRVTDDRSLNINPVWLSRQGALLWVSDRDGGRDLYRSALDGRGRVVGSPTRLTTGLNVQGVSLSADGRRLGYSVYTETSNVFMVRLARDRSRSVSEATPLTSGTQIVELLDVSRDGQWLAFDSDRGGKQHIFRQQLPSGAPEQLTSDPADDFGPAFSPDGHEIAFHRIEHGARDIYVMPAEGGPPTRLTTNPLDDLLPNWSPDGRTIAYSCVTRDAREACTLTRSGRGWGAPRQLTRNGAINPRFSPDGRWIAFRAPGGALFVMTSEGGETRAVPDSAALGIGPGFMIWSADGRSLIYDVYPGGRFSLRAVPVAGGPSREVLHVDDPARQSHRYGLAMRGDSLFFSLVTRQADIWVADLQ